MEYGSEEIIELIEAVKAGELDFSYITNASGTSFEGLRDKVQELMSSLSQLDTDFTTEDRQYSVASSNISSSAVSYFDFLEKISGTVDLGVRQDVFNILQMKNWFGTNETDWVKAIFSMRSRDGVYIGTGFGGQNLSMFCHGNFDLAVIVDMNPFVAEVYMPIRAALIKIANSRAEFLSLFAGIKLEEKEISQFKDASLEKIISIIFEKMENAGEKRSDVLKEMWSSLEDQFPQGTKEHAKKFWDYYFAKSKNSRYILRKMRDAMNQGGSWLSSEQNFHKIKQMSDQGKILGVVGNFLDSNVMTRLGSYLNAQELEAATVYISNIREWFYRGQGIVQGNADTKKLEDNIGLLPFRRDAVVIDMHRGIKIVPVMPDSVQPGDDSGGTVSSGIVYGEKEIQKTMKQSKYAPGAEYKMGQLFFNGKKAEPLGYGRANDVFVFPADEEIAIRFHKRGESREINQWLSGQEITEFQKLSKLNISPAFISWGIVGRRYYLAVERIFGESLEKKYNKNNGDKVLSKNELLLVRGLLVKLLKNKIYVDDFKPSQIMIGHKPRETNEEAYLVDVELANLKEGISLIELAERYKDFFTVNRDEYVDFLENHPQEDWRRYDPNGNLIKFLDKVVETGKVGIDLTDSASSGISPDSARKTDKTMATESSSLHPLEKRVIKQGKSKHLGTVVFTPNEVNALLEEASGNSKEQKGYLFRLLKIKIAKLYNEVVSKIYESLNYAPRRSDLSKLMQYEEIIKRICLVNVENALDAYLQKREEDKNFKDNLELYFYLFNQKEHIVLWIVNNGRSINKSENTEEKNERAGVGSKRFGGRGAAVSFANKQADKIAASYDLFDRMEKIGDTEGAISELKIEKGYFSYFLEGLPHGIYLNDKFKNKKDSKGTKMKKKKGNVATGGAGTASSTIAAGTAENKGRFSIDDINNLNNEKIRGKNGKEYTLKVEHKSEFGFYAGTMQSYDENNFKILILSENGLQVGEVLIPVLNSPFNKRDGELVARIGNVMILPAYRGLGIYKEFINRLSKVMPQGIFLSSRIKNANTLIPLVERVISELDDKRPDQDMVDLFLEENRSSLRSGKIVVKNDVRESIETIRRLEEEIVESKDIKEAAEARREIEKEMIAVEQFLYQYNELLQYTKKNMKTLWKEKRINNDLSTLTKIVNENSDKIFLSSIRNNAGFTEHTVEVNRKYLSSEDDVYVIELYSQKGASSPVGNDRYGGIDFNANNFNIETKGQGVDFDIPLGIENMDLTNIEGLTPVIINITPVTNFYNLLGLSESTPLQLSYLSKS